MRELDASFEEISECCSMNLVDVERHFTTCVATPTPATDESEEKEIAGTDDELRDLLDDAQESYHSAVLQGNPPAASSALSVRLRILTELGNRQRLRTETRTNLDHDDPLAPACDWSESRRVWMLSYFDGLLKKVAKNPQLVTETIPQGQAVKGIVCS